MTSNQRFAFLLILTIAGLVGATAAPDTARVEFWAAGATRAGAAVPDCRSSGTTIDANSRARLFYVGAAGSHTLYVCWLGEHRVSRLGYLQLRESGPDVPVLAGRWVAYDRLRCGEPETCRARVIVIDAKTGRRVRQGPAQDQRTARIVLTDRGTAAWIRDRVYKLDTRGVLSAIGEVSPTVADYESLALARERAYWLQADTPRSALLE